MFPHDSIDEGGETVKKYLDYKAMLVVFFLVHMRLEGKKTSSIESQPICAIKWLQLPIQVS